MTRRSGHPLAQVLRASADGRPPPGDGRVRVLPPADGLASAVVAFAAHHVVVAPISVAEVDQALTPGEVAGPMQPAFLSWLAERIGAVAGQADVLLVAPARPASPSLAVVPRDDLASHPRVARAHHHRREIRVLSDGESRGVVVIGRGLVDRLEVAVEVDEAHRGTGVACGLFAAAAALADGEPLFAQVAPGNAPALRAALAAGYRPIGAEVLLLHAGA